MELRIFKNILDFFDKNLYGNKVSDTGFFYSGLIIDDYFDNSILSIDFLNLNFYLEDIGDTEFDEKESFSNLYLNIAEDKRIILVEKILKILKHTSSNKEENQQIIEKVLGFLKNNNYTITNNNSTLEILKSKLIGHGSYCNVFQETEDTVIKILKSEYSKKEDFKKRLKYEFENTLKLKASPNIIKVFEYNPNDNSYTMEKCNCDLYTFKQNNIDISRDNKIKIALDILNGMKYAHDNNIIHRDLHLGNILQVDNNFVIADFGWSKDLNILRSLKSSSSPKSSNRYVAPEAISDFTKLDKKTDIYSIGQILDDIFRNPISSKHEFSSIVNKSIDRNRSNRYDNINQIINDFNSLLKIENKKLLEEETLKNIKKYNYNIHVQQYILNLAENSSLSHFIVRHTLSEFDKLFLQFNDSEQFLLIQSVEETFANATGYNGWINYDLFTNIACGIYINENVDVNVRKNALNIIEYCANTIKRHHAIKILETL